MPELPEIELIRQYTEENFLNHEIAEVDIRDASVVEPAASDLKKALVGTKLTNTQRLGKYLFISTEKGPQLVFHFGMTGKLVFAGEDKKKEPAYSRFVLSFKNKEKLYYADRRKIGKIYLAESLEAFKQDKSLGQDALEVSLTDFETALEDKRGMIKAVLMDQHVISGIGNVYADEILFQERIHPKTHVDKLDRKALKNLYDTIRDVLKTAINYRGKRKDLPQHYLTPFRKEDGKCPTGSGKIEMIKVGGRSTYFCPSRQKLAQ